DFVHGDSLGLTTRYEYDLNDSLLAIVDARNQRTAFEYDTEENLITITNTRGERTTLTYDALGRQIRTVYFDDRVERYEYDDRDRVSAIRMDQGDPIVEFTYDDMDRLVERRWADGRRVVIVYGTQNQILGLLGRDLDLEYEWDAAMRVTRERIGAVTLDLTTISPATGLASSRPGAGGSGTSGMLAVGSRRSPIPTSMSTSTPITCPTASRRFAFRMGSSSDSSTTPSIAWSHGQS